jgi:phage shock protein A
MKGSARENFFSQRTFKKEETMGIFNRFTDILKANVNDLLDKAEDPEKMLKQMVIEMEEAVYEATMALGNAIANEKTLAHQMENKTKEAEGYQQKAVEAVKMGRDDLAKQALERKVMLLNAAKDLEGPLTEAQASTADLKRQVDQLKDKLEEARMRQSTLVARAQAAKAKKRIAKSVSGIGHDGFAGFEKFEQKIEKEEAEAEAFQQIAGEATATVDQELEKLSTTSQADDELAKLKESLKGS